MSTDLVFHDTRFNAITLGNQIWMTSKELAQALKYKSSKSITNLYNKNSEEFTTGMTQVIESVTTGNYRKKTRIFSLRGAHLMAMFARTPVAKEFRRWVLDILDKEVVGKTRKVASGKLTVEQQEAIKELIHSRCDVLPDKCKKGAAVKMWSALSSHFGCTYKAIPTEQFTEALSLVSRLPLKGEVIEKAPASSFVNYPLNADLYIQIRDGQTVFVQQAKENEIFISPELFCELMETKGGYLVIEREKLKSMSIESIVKLVDKPAVKIPMRKNSN